MRQGCRRNQGCSYVYKTVASATTDAAAYTFQLTVAHCSIVLLQQQP
jgi:hypothetical protein